MSTISYGPHSHRTTYSPNQRTVTVATVRTSSQTSFTGAYSETTTSDLNGACPCDPPAPLAPWHSRSRSSFRIVVTYRGERVEGLTGQDMVAAISPAYGRPTRPAAQIIISGMSQDWTDTEQVLARWADERFSVNLFHTSYPSTFGLVIFSKRVAPLARAAIDKAILIERAEAPEREAAAKKSQEVVEAATHAKARLANKAAFTF